MQRATLMKRKKLDIEPASPTMHWNGQHYSSDASVMQSPQRNGGINRAVTASSALFSTPEPRVIAKPRQCLTELLLQVPPPDGKNGDTLAPCLSSQLLKTLSILREEEIQLTEHLAALINFRKDVLRRADDSIDMSKQIDDQVDRMDQKLIVIKGRISRMRETLRTVKASDVASAARVIPYDPTNPIHAAMALSPNISFTTLDAVPVLAGETIVDILRLPLIPASTQDLPVLDLSQELKEAVLATLTTSLITAIHHFLDRFYSVYMNSLTETLFDLLAWRFLDLALKQEPQDKVSNVSRDFLRFLSDRPVNDRPWAFVKECVRTAFKYDLCDIAAKLARLKCEPNENVSNFVSRTRVLIGAGSLLPEKDLVNIIYRALPARGQQWTLTRFKSRDAIPDHETYLNYIHDNTTILHGKRASTDLPPEVVAHLKSIGIRIPYDDDKGTQA